MILYWNKPSVSWNPSSWSSVTPLINLNSKNWKIVSVSVEIRIHHLTSRPAILKHSGLSEWTVLLMLLLTKVIPGFDSSWEECIVICILYTCVHWFTTTWPLFWDMRCCWPPCACKYRILLTLYNQQWEYLVVKDARQCGFFHCRLWPWVSTSRLPRYKLQYRIGYKTLEKHTFEECTSAKQSICAAVTNSYHESHCPCKSIVDDSL